VKDKTRRETRIKFHEVIAVPNLLYGSGMYVLKIKKKTHDQERDGRCEVVTGQGHNPCKGDSDSDTYMKCVSTLCVCAEVEISVLHRNHLDLKM
jgi:hypothetical protein